MPAAPLSGDRFATRLSRQMGETLRLALPVMAARSGFMVMMAVDTVIVGRFSAEELAYYGLAHQPGGMLIAIGIGLLIGTIAMTAHALGAGHHAECGRVWRRSLPYAVLLGIAGALLSLLGGPGFRLAGLDPALSDGAGEAMAILGLGLPGIYLCVVSTFFLEGIKRPWPGLIAMVIANIVNAGLNWWFVWGGLGLPAMGATGSAWATTLVRTGLGLGLVAYVWWMPGRGHWGVRGPLAGWWREGAAERRLGYGGGSSNALEASSFALLGVFAGLFGPLALGAYTVGFNLLVLPFMAALGLASATAVQVGVAYGRGDAAGMALAGWTGLGLTVGIVGVIGAGFGLFPEAVAGLFTVDPDLLARAVPLVSLTALIVVADGGQAVMAQALRARNDAWVPAALHFVSYYVVMLPVCVVLAFEFNRGAVGLFEGVLVASVISVAILSVRFALLGRRDHPRPAGVVCMCES